MQNKTIKDLSIVELKALVYDETMMIKQSQNNIGILNNEINSRQQAPVEQPIVDEKGGMVAEKEEQSNGETNI